MCICDSMGKIYFSEPMRDPEGFLTEEEFKKLLSFADGIRDRILLKFLFYTGRRVSEVVRSVKVEDCDFKNNTILFTILKKKNPIQKRFNVDANVMEDVRKLIEFQELGPDDFLFSINRFRVDQIIKKIAVKAGMEYVGNHKLHAHTFRHSYAVMKAKDCKDMYELGRLQHQLQHANITMTSYYFEHFNLKEREFTDVSKKSEENDSGS